MTSGREGAGASRTRERLLRGVIAAAVGLAAPSVEIALRCRPPLQTSETCVWLKAYLPLTRPLYFVACGLLTYGILSLAAVAARQLRRRA
ncbi:MAG TPA: hypothetical protein VF006_18730 [Longimicrobium sp.]